jgi:glycosyltransferase involved in cell wall biosynthesis
MITGEYPPDTGGIGDYTKLLMGTAEAENWKLFYKNRWNLIYLAAYIKELSALKPDAVFLQYPARHYKWCILPFLLCVYFSMFTKVKFIPVLHEYSELHPLKKILMNLVIFTAKRIIVTSAFEKTALIGKNGRLEHSIDVVKILSNIEGTAGKKALKTRGHDIVYFGLISRNKGIEYFIEAVANYRKKKPALNAAIIGGFPRTGAFHRYYEHIAELARKAGIRMAINRPSADIGAMLNDSKILLLPFPDGCSERRGSYLAGIKNGCVIITRKGRYTTGPMLKTAFFLSDKADINDMFDRILIDMTETGYIEWQKNIDKYILAELPASWEDIARAYNNISKKRKPAD